MAKCLAFFCFCERQGKALKLDAKNDSEAFFLKRLNKKNHKEMAVWLFGQCWETELGQARAFAARKSEKPLPFATVQLSCEAVISLRSIFRFKISGEGLGGIA